MLLIDISKQKRKNGKEKIVDDSDFTARKGRPLWVLWEIELKRVRGRVLGGKESRFRGCLVLNTLHTE